MAMLSVYFIDPPYPSDPALPIGAATRVDSIPFAKQPSGLGERRASVLLTQHPIALPKNWQGDCVLSAEA